MHFYEIITIYKIYFHKLKNALEIDLTNGSLDSKEISKIDYGMVSGIVRPDDAYIISHYNNYHRGVLRSLKITEYFSKWRNEKWVDDSRGVSDIIEHVPFNIVSKIKKPSPFKIHIDSPLMADYLLESLQLTFEKYEKKHDSFAEVIVEKLFTDEITRGIKTTEKMLKTKTPLIAFGRLEKIVPNTEFNESLPSSESTELFRLSKPYDDEFPFIVTSLSRSALIDRLRTSTKILKVFLIIFGSIGAVLGTYIIYKYFIQRNSNRDNSRRSDDQNSETIF